MRRFVFLIAFIILSAVVVTGVAAQQETCSPIVTHALEQLSSNCGDLQRNAACYGYNHVTATFFDSLAPDAFTQPNDRVELASLQSITTSPLNIDTQQWGIAVVKAQANLPDALPGQAVTFLLMGDVQLRTALEQDSDQNPMQAVYFTTGIGDTRCSDAPESSLIIQGPENITVDLRVNGANIQLGSTLIFRSGEDNSMECGVLDGAAVVGRGGQVIPAGFSARVPLDENLNTDGDWGANEPLTNDDASALQVLRELPDGLLNYMPDVPTAEEIDMLAALDAQLIASLDSHLVRNLARLLIATNTSPELVAEWDVQLLRGYIASNATDVVEVDDQPFTSPEFIESLIAALDEYLRP